MMMFGLGRRPSPVRAEIAPEASVKVKLARVEAQAENAAATVDNNDLDQFVRARAKLAAKSGLPPTLQQLLKAPSLATVGTLRECVDRSLSALLDVYVDGKVTESELPKLARALSEMRPIVELGQSPLVRMLPRDVAERLQAHLFEPLDVLSAAARAREGDVMNAVSKRDRKALFEKLATVKHEWRSVDLAALKGTHAGTLAGIERYANGDYVAVPIRDGGCVLGVVTGVENDGLRVEVYDGHDDVALKKLGFERVRDANPLKLGEHHRVADGQLYIDRVEGGELVALLQTSKGVRELRGAAIRAYADELQQRMNGALPPLIEPTGVRAGGFESTSIESVKNDVVDGALFTYRGIDYKPFNEDAVVLGVVDDVAFAGVFDQAGESGRQVKGRVGHASQLAAEAFAAAATKRAADRSDAKVALRRAAEDAHGAVRAANQVYGIEALTTMVGVVVENGTAHVVSCGDSQAWLFGGDGKLKNETIPDNRADMIARETGDPNKGLDESRFVTTSLGVVDEAPDIHTSSWRVARGDTLVLVSDGVADANLIAQKRDVARGLCWMQGHGDVTAREIGKLVRACATAEAATAAILEYTKNKNAAGDAKNDNVSIVVLKIT